MSDQNFPSQAFEQTPDDHSIEHEATSSDAASEASRGQMPEQEMKPAEEVVKPVDVTTEEETSLAEGTAEEDTFPSDVTTEEEANPVIATEDEAIPPVDVATEEEAKPFEGTTEEVAKPTNAMAEQDQDTRLADAIELARKSQASFLGLLPPFWHDRFIEGALVLSMALYYVVGNENIGTGALFRVNPLLTLPFLFLFAVLCWYRLAFALALLPLSLPFYPLPKTVFEGASFSPAEIIVWICLVVALLQFVVRRRKEFSWQQMRERLGPMLWPMLVFLLAALVSVFIAYYHKTALRAFREEVLVPLVYVVLLLVYMRSRQDTTRLLYSLFGAGLLVTLMGLGQYFLFRDQLKLEADGIRRVHAIYGSANSVGLFLDYLLPLGLAFVLIPRGSIVRGWSNSLVSRLLIGICCLLMIGVIYLSNSGGALVALPFALLFVVACMLKSRKVRLISALVLIGLILLGGGVFYKQINHYVFERHANSQGVGTLTKRLFLWQSALDMIEAHPVFGVGMDNWLCYYSRNTICFTPQLHHFWIMTNPATNGPTGLRDEPELSHPHNIFLHVWVSIGIFGLLAFIGILGLFCWLLFRILKQLRQAGAEADPWPRWVAVGLGASLLAALVQGMVDSAFLERDLAFCFWILITALLLVRFQTKTPWRQRRVAASPTE